MLMSDIKAQFNSETTRNEAHKGMKGVLGDVKEDESPANEKSGRKAEGDLNSSVRVKQNEPRLEGKHKRLESKNSLITSFRYMQD